jgi:ribosomal 50S subunit-associated protein YjgA (DUF615 family)
MKRERFSDEKILQLLRAAKDVADLPAFCARKKITERTFNLWLDVYGERLSEPSETLRPTRSERARAAGAINELGLKLVALSQQKLDLLELPEELRLAVESCRTLTKGARSRQKRLVGKILRSEDHEEIRKQFESL